jgi:putative flippase GtrA
MSSPAVELRESRFGAIDAPEVDVVIPVYNEERALGECVERLVAHLAHSFPFSWRVTIVDNASTDGTWPVATSLAHAHAGVDAIHLDSKGRGRALRAAWMRSEAAVVAYMDVDLSTDLRALLPLVAPLVSGHSDVAIGSRLARGARVERGPRREFISRSYNAMLRLVFRNGFRDAQCGFKALRGDVAKVLLPQVDDEEWFFDTELLLVAERGGLRIAEIPVDWTDDPDSRVDVARTAIDDVRGMVRVARRFWFVDDQPRLGALTRAAVSPGTGGELVSFATVGFASTALWMVLLLLLAPTLGLVAANAVALTASMLANTAAHRRWTFRRTRRERRRDWTRALVVHAVGLGLTTGAIVTARAIAPDSTGLVVVLLTAASVLSTALRFLLMPAWTFRQRHR